MYSRACRTIAHQRSLFRNFCSSRSLSMPASASRDLAVIYAEWANKPTYVQLLKERGVPVFEVEQLDEADYDKVTFATVWKPKPGFLSQFPNLKVAMSLGAGVDTLMAPGQVPEHITITRIVDPLMAQRMATWVLWGVINWQRKMEQYAEAQRNCRWDLTIEPRSNRDNAEVAVGVMGLGVMGLATAQQLLALGYKVSGWSRTAAAHQQHQEQGIKCYAGQQQLHEFVQQQDVLVCLLPLTQETTGIINKQLLSWLPRGSAVINGGRGKQLVETDLLDALDNGQVGFALLDVFDPEPLPPTSRLWTHPAVRLTPHVASFTTLQTAVDQIAANFHSVVAGNGPLLPNLVDKSRGY